MSGIVARQIRVSGRVQGVGFRAALRDEARRLGVTGWVRNRADGTVEALAQGAPDAVDAIVSWAHRGPPGAGVAQVEVRPAATEAFSGAFELRPTL